MLSLPGLAKLSFTASFGVVSAIGLRPKQMSVLLAAAFTVKLNWLMVEFPAASVTVTNTVYVPGAVYMCVTEPVLVVALVVSPKSQVYVKPDSVVPTVN